MSSAVPAAVVHPVSRRRRPSVARILLIGSLLVFVVLVAFPVVNMAINAFRGTQEIVARPVAISGLTLENFVYVFTRGNANVPVMYRNSFLLTSISVTIVVVVSAMCGYYLARSDKKAAQVLLMVFLAGLMIPDEITLLPLVQLFARLGLIGKIPGMFLYYAGHNTAVAIFMYTQFVRTIPRELDEAAVIDGAGPFRRFWSVVFPLVRPCTATILVFVGFNIWNDFMVPLYLLRGPQSQTITLGVYTALGPYHSNWGLVFCFVFIATVPVIALYAALQKWIIAGLTAGAVKS